MDRLKKDSDQNQFSYNSETDNSLCSFSYFFIILKTSFFNTQFERTIFTRRFISGFCKNETKCCYREIQYNLIRKGKSLLSFKQFLYSV